MIPCKEVAGAHISRKEINKEKKSGGTSVMILRWSNLVMEEMAGSSRGGIYMLQVGGLHSG